MTTDINGNKNAVLGNKKLSSSKTIWGRSNYGFDHGKLSYG